MSFDPSDRAILARHRFPVARGRDVRTAPVAATLLDAPLVVYRAGGTVVVADDICPHRGVPLSLGSGDWESVACAYHGIRYGAGGACVMVPAHPAARIPARLTLRTYPAVERYGLVWTCAVSNYAHGGPAAPDGFRWLRRFDVHLPFTATLEIHSRAAGGCTQWCSGRRFRRRYVPPRENPSDPAAAGPVTAAAPGARRAPRRRTATG